MTMGCHSGTVKSDPIKALVASSSMFPCNERPLAEDGSFKTRFKNHVQLIEAYELCKARHESLTSLIDKLNQ